jgi:serine phosphatase RsbU (regulator of sigma subunit)
LNFPNLEVKSLSWYFLPKILSHFLQLYLLAILFKIPFVLIYHHATLHRKLQIAGWLQSTIPQFIQLLILLLIFFFFMSAWQGENLKKNMIQLLGTPPTLQTKSGLTIQQLNEKSPTGEIQLPGLESIKLPENWPSSAVLELKKADNPEQKEFFVYFHSASENDSTFTLIKIDNLFLSALKKNFVNISANGLISYPFTLNSWDSVFYKIRIWGGTERQQAFNVFPFGLIPHTFPGYQSIRLVDVKEGQSEELKQGNIKIINQNVFTAARIYTLLLDNNFQKIGYWSFETVIVLDLPFMKSTLMKQLLFWLLIYALINIFIIQRVIKFGNQINQIILQKFNLLTQGIRQISSGNLNHKISMEGEDEFVELAEHLNSMGSDLQKKISDLREMDRLEYELRMAREVQISLLPQTLPQIPGYQLSARMSTATEVGGDFYDALTLDNQKYLLVIGDVSGKGTSAAFYMAQCISLIRFSCQFSQDPREILIRLNRYFSDPMIDKQIFVTAVLGLLDPRKNQVTLLRPGHNQPILIPADANLPIQELKLSGIGIGLEREGKIFEKTLGEKVIQLKKADTLFFYSDGLVDAYSNGRPDSTGKADFYGDERLINLLQTLRGKQPSEIQERVTAELAAFYGNSPLIDDMTMLILQRTK